MYILNNLHTKIKKLGNDSLFSWNISSNSQKRKHMYLNYKLNVQFIHNIADTKGDVFLLFPPYVISVVVEKILQRI